MDRILEEITQGDNITQGELTDLISNAGQRVYNNMTTLIVSLVLGLLLCFLGFKLVKLWSAVEGFIIGAAVGLAACVVLGLTGTAVLLVILFAGLLLMALCLIFKRLGMFWVCLFAGSSIGLVVMYIDGMAGVLVGLAVGVIAAILGAVLREPVVISMTAIQGGIVSGAAAAGLIGIDNIWIRIGISALCAVVGMFTQFMFKSREIGKRETVHAKNIREEESMESEVEAARNILDDDDEEAEEDDSPEETEDLDGVGSEVEFVDLDDSEGSDSIE